MVQNAFAVRLSGEAGVSSLDGETVGLGLVVVVKRSGARDQREPCRPIRFAHPRRPYACRPYRDGIDEKEAPRTVGETTTILSPGCSRPSLLNSKGASG
jgi:hypothetical protein